MCFHSPPSATPSASSNTRFQPIGTVLRYNWTTGWAHVYLEFLAAYPSTVYELVSSTETPDGSDDGDEAGSSHCLTACDSCYGSEQRPSSRVIWDLVDSSFVAC